MLIVLYSSKKVANTSGLLPILLHMSLLEMTRLRSSHTTSILILSMQTLISMKSFSHLPCLLALSRVLQQQTSVTASKREISYFPRMFTRMETWRPWKKKIRNGMSVVILHGFTTRPMLGIGMSGKESRDNSCSVFIFPKTTPVYGSLAAIILIILWEDLNMYLSPSSSLVVYLCDLTVYPGRAFWRNWRLWCVCDAHSLHHKGP